MSPYQLTWGGSGFGVYPNYLFAWISWSICSTMESETVAMWCLATPTGNTAALGHWAIWWECIRVVVSPPLTCGPWAQADPDGRFYGVSVGWCTIALPGSRYNSCSRKHVWFALSCYKKCLSILHPVNKRHDFGTAPARKYNSVILIWITKVARS